MLWKAAQLAVFFGWVLVFTSDPEMFGKSGLGAVALVSLAFTALTFTPIIWLCAWLGGWSPIDKAQPGAFDNLRRKLEVPSEDVDRSNRRR